MSPAFDLPIEVKLNAEDCYLRVAAPFYQVVHFRRPLFHPQQLSVTNVYGVPVFHVLPATEARQTAWVVQHQHQTLLQVQFAEVAPLAHQAGDTLVFSVAPGEAPNAAELQMLCAAFAVCCQHVQQLQGANQAIA